VLTNLRRSRTQGARSYKPRFLRPTERRHDFPTNRISAGTRRNRSSNCPEHFPANYSRRAGALFAQDGAAESACSNPPTGDPSNGRSTAVFPKEKFLPESLRRNDLLRPFSCRIPKTQEPSPRKREPKQKREWGKGPVFPSAPTLEPRSKPFFFFLFFFFFFRTSCGWPARDTLRGRSCGPRRSLYLIPTPERNLRVARPNSCRKKGLPRRPPAAPPGN